MGAWGRSVFFLPRHCPVPPDIRLDWETYAPEEKEDQLLELLVFYGPPFPLRNQDGNELLWPESPESSRSFWSPSLSHESMSSLEAAHSVSKLGGRSRACCPGVASGP